MPVKHLLEAVWAALGELGGADVVREGSATDWFTLGWLWGLCLPHWSSLTLGKEL